MSDIKSGEIKSWTKEDFRKLMEWSSKNVKFKYRNKSTYTGSDFTHKNFFTFKDLYNRHYRESLGKITKNYNLTQSQLFVMTVFNLGVSVGNMETKKNAIYEIRYKLKERTQYNLNVMDYLITKYKIQPEELK